MVREPVVHQVSPLVINDVSRLNQIHVNEVISPTSTAEIVEAVRQHPGPISIGGSRHSMGGQIATEGALFIDMRKFDHILDFDEFIPPLQTILRRHNVNVINVSIRHANQDPGSLLAWARTEVFAFVVYYKQGSDDVAREEVGVWTRELIDAALRLGGSYYLPYQLHATQEQFLRAYPRAAEFIALKRRLDPTDKFRNELLDKYFHSVRSK